ncbi:MAG: hypothetical protein Fur0041_17260 [Bacteroidia bacterium]
MRYPITLLFSMLSVMIFAQDRLHIVKKYSSGTVSEDYHLDENGFKHGPYQRYTRFGKIYIQGYYVHGQPDSTWTYYAPDSVGAMVQKLDFKTRKEIFLDTLKVPQLICGPRFFGGNMLQMEYIQYRMQKDFTPAEYARYKNKTFTVSFTVDSVSLKPALIMCDNATIPDNIKKKMIAIVNDMPAFLPPACPGRDPVWRISVPFYFR